MAQTEEQRRKADYMREYTRLNKERINAQRRARRDEATRAREKQWRAQNRDKMLDYKRTDREKRPEDYARWKREWAARNAERITEKKRKDYAAQKEWIRCRLAQFRRDNPDQTRETQKRYGAKRRARIAGIEYEPIDRRAIYLRDHQRCWICKRYVRWTDFSLDHVVPISKGGAHVASNLKTSHLDCNRRRGNRGPAQAGLGPL